MAYRFVSVLVSACFLMCGCTTPVENSHLPNGSPEETREEPPPPPDPDPEWRSPVAVNPEVRAEVEGLIEQLIEFDPNENLRACLHASSFPLADDADEHLAQVYENWKVWRHPKPIRRLCEIGADAVPVLCEYLLDERETMCEWNYSNVVIGGAWFAQEYDWNDGWQNSPGREFHYFDSPSRGSARTYTFRVGDFCYAVIGKIVNRNFHALRGQPSMCYVLNSPVKAPILASLVRRDWGSLTPANFRDSLIRDWYRPDLASNERLRRWTGAYVRLAYYWPDDAVHLVREWLRKPRVDWFSVYGVYKDLVAALQKGNLTEAWEDAKRNLAPAEKEVLISTIKEAAHDVPHFPGKPHAKTLLHRLFPGEDPHREREYHAVTNVDLRDSIDFLMHDEDAQIDDLVVEILTDVEAYFPDSARGQTHLALACIGRLHRRPRNDDAVLAAIKNRNPDATYGEKSWEWYEHHIINRDK